MFFKKAIHLAEHLRKAENWAKKAQFGAGAGLLVLSEKLEDKEWVLNELMNNGIGQDKIYAYGVFRGIIFDRLFSTREKAVQYIEEDDSNYKMAKKLSPDNPDNLWYNGKGDALIVQRLVIS
jgi:hypothetical protein